MDLKQGPLTQGGRPVAWVSMRNDQVKSGPLEGDVRFSGDGCPAGNPGRAVRHTGAERAGNTV